MARIDSILGIALQQNCDELRVASDIEPKMFSNGASKRLHLPAMSTDMLRDMLGDILSPERDAELASRERVDVKYQTDAGVAFDVIITKRGSGFEARFLKSTGNAPRRLPAPVSAPMQIAAPVAPAPVLAESAAVPVAMPVAVSPPATSDAPALWSLPDNVIDLFVHARETGATDLHLREGEEPSIRVDGRIRRLGTEPIVHLAVFLGLDRNAMHALHTGHGLDRSFDFGGGRARVHVYRSMSGTSAAVRFLPHSPPALASLTAPERLDDLIQLPHGLVLICGATGSGKSTTLAALAAEALRQRSIMLVTLEHPVEYMLGAGESSLVRQREIGRDCVDFASGLRDAMREDPDVIVVGEMRDPDTIALALTAAETGHLVLATLHSGSCASAVQRIVDAYPPERQEQIRSQLADVLRVVVAQRLLPRARGRGRILAAEVLRMTHGAGAMIREGKTHQLGSLIQSSKKDGCIPLERALADRVLANEVRAEDARAAANDQASFDRYLNGIRP